MPVQIGELRDSSLIAQRLAPNDRILCASPEYLARRGRPRRPQDLRAHDCIALRENDEDVTLWRFANANGGGRVSIRIEPPVTSNDGEVVRGWALAGLGVIVRSEWDVAEDLRAGRLVSLLEDWRLPTADVFVLLGARHGRSARVVRFLEQLRAALTPPPWRAESASMRHDHSRSKTSARGERDPEAPVTLSLSKGAPRWWPMLRQAQHDMGRFRRRLLFRERRYDVVYGNRVIRQRCTALRVGRVQRYPENRNSRSPVRGRSQDGR